MVIAGKNAVQQVTRPLIGTIGVAAAALLVYALRTADARHVESGDPYPGAVTATMDVVGYFLTAGLGALCFGALVFIVICSRPDQTGTIDVTAYRAHRFVAAASPVWAVLAWIMVTVAGADASGITPLRLVGEGYLGQALEVSEAAVAWLVVAVCATVVALVIRFTLRWMVYVLLALTAVIAVVAPVMAGNAGQGPNHDYMTSLGVLVAVTIALSAGLRVAALTAPEPESADNARIVARRVAVTVLVTDVVALVATTSLMAFLLPLRYLFSTPFGVIAIGMFVLQVAVVAVDVRVLRRARAGDAVGWAGVAGAALLVLVLACWAASDTRVAPGLLAHPFTAWDVFLGYELTGPPTFWRLLTVWRFDFLIGSAAIVAAIGYLVGVRRLRRRGDHWPVGRTVAWLAGCVTVVVVTGSGVRAYGSAMFSVHMAEHMALNMFAPVLLVLGAPATLALRAFPTTGDGQPGPRDWVSWLVHSRVTRVLSNPIVALALFVGSLYAVYFTSIFDTLVRYHWGHILLTLHFLIVGYLFFWVIIGIDPGPRRVPYLGRIGLLFAVMPFHAFFGIALMTMSTVVADRFYRELSLPWISDLLDDQWLGGAIAWGASEVPIVLVVVAIVTQWARSDRRAGRRADRHADTYEDTELDAYNKMLEELSRSRH
ncbi:cytochrome c oxidase assembly protein [Gordonia sinesedis]